MKTQTVVIKPMRTYDIHPLAKLFPALNGAAFDELRKDIQTKGVQQPVILYEGMILDGAQRFKAAREVGVEPITIQFTGLPPNIVNAGPLSFVVSANLNRRHLSTSERAELAVKLAEQIAERSLGRNRPKLSKRGRKGEGRPT